MEELERRGTARGAAAHRRGEAPVLHRRDALWQRLRLCDGDRHGSPAHVRIPILAAALVLVGYAAATAAPAIEWTAPEGCPDHDAVVQRIANQLGGHIDGPLHAELAAARDASGRWRLRLAMRTPGGVAGKREIEGATCEEVTTAAALIIALAIREEAGADSAPASERVAEAPPAEAPESTDPAPASEAVAAAPPAEAPVPIASSRGAPLRWLVRAGVGGEAGTLPGVGPGIGVAIGMVRSRLRVELLGAYWPSRRATASSPTMGGNLDLLAGTVRGCVEIAHGIAPCGSVEIGALEAVGVGISNATHHRSAWIAPGVGLLAPWQLSRSLYAVGHADAVLPVIRPHYTIDGVAGDVFQPAAVAARVWVAIEARFP
jgi:hypothetical protein